MGFNVWNVLIVLVIVLLLFGTKKLRNVGGDLGSALKGFKKAMSEDDTPEKKDADFTSVEDQSSDTKTVKHDADSKSAVKKD